MDLFSGSDRRIGNEVQISRDILEVKLKRSNNHLYIVDEGDEKMKATPRRATAT